MIMKSFDFLSGVRERKAELGIVDTLERIGSMRNSGTRRTSEKRAMLKRIDERAEKAGGKAPKGYY